MNKKLDNQLVEAWNKYQYYFGFAREKQDQLWKDSEPILKKLRILNIRRRDVEFSPSLVGYEAKELYMLVIVKINQFDTYCPPLIDEILSRLGKELDLKFTRSETGFHFCYNNLK